MTEIEACKDNGTDSKLTKINEIALDAATIYYSTLHMATNPAHVVDRALLQLESGSMGDLIGRILTKIEACKDEVKMTGQNSFRLVLHC